MGMCVYGGSSSKSSPMSSLIKLPDDRAAPPGAVEAGELNRIANLLLRATIPFLPDRVAEGWEGLANDAARDALPYR